MINDLINGEPASSFCLSCGRLLYLTEPEVSNTKRTAKAGRPDDSSRCAGDVEYVRPHGKLRWDGRGQGSVRALPRCRLAARLALPQLPLAGNAAGRVCKLTRYLGHPIMPGYRVAIDDVPMN